MKCIKCGSYNTEGAVYCRHCGQNLMKVDFSQTNVMDRFPEYNFIPTNFYDWRKPWFARIRCIIASVLLIGSICLMIACIVDRFVVVGLGTGSSEYIDDFNEYRVQANSYTGLSYGVGYAEDERAAIEVALSRKNNQINQSLIVSCFLPVLFGIILYYGRREFPEKNNLLRNSADYVQKYRYTGFIRGRKTPILKFYVKDNKMGLLDVAHYCVFLNAQYDKLEWREKNKFLNAKLGNRTFIIDIYGKELK